MFLPMSLVNLYGHQGLRRRLESAIDRGALPGSLLIHGPRGIGKQRLALWLGQRLLCTGAAPRPCGTCQSCRYASLLAHPDLRWFFPRPKLKDADGSADEVLQDYAGSIAERAATGGIYLPPSGADALYVATVRAIVRIAAFTPTLGTRKVIVVGDAERMVPQEGADQAANAFLKLLEEPPANTTLILTTSEPGALLATVRSRLVAFRASPLAEVDIQMFLKDPVVQTALTRVDTQEIELATAATGAPGAILASAGRNEARDAARAFLDASLHGRGERFRATLALGSSKARGFFFDMLDALTMLLHARIRDAGRRGDPATQVAAGRAMEAVEAAKVRATGNVSPQLIGASLGRQLAELLG